MIPIRDTIKARKPPIITVFLILANIAVFIYELFLSSKELEEFIHIWGVVPARFLYPNWTEGAGYPNTSLLPFVTCLFLHGGWFHLISNMWALWLFGDNVEDRMGHFRFFVFYIICGLLAGFVNVAIYPSSRIPTIGASGAIAGIMGAYFLLFPFSRILVLVPVFFYPLFFEVPAVFYLFFWFFSQFLSGTASLKQGTGEMGGIAFWAHVGGFIAGLFFLRFFVKKSRRRKTSRFYSHG